MPHLPSLEFLIVGAIVGLAVAIFPGIVVHGETTFNLDQRLRTYVGMPQGILIIAAVVLMLATSFRIYWKEFFGALYAVAVGTRILWQMGLRGQLGHRLARRLRSFYRYEPYRYKPYVSPFDMSVLGAFEGNVNDFSPTNAIVCAQIARLAYEKPRTVPQVSVPPGCRVQPLEFKNHAGIVLGLPSAVIVAFRGTDDFRDWMTNLAVWTKAPWPDWGRVHAGFLAAVEALWPQVQSAINAFREHLQPVWFTGHSLGGAMALLGAVKLSVELPSIKIGGVYTFGQPRVGNYAFTKALTARVSWPLVRMEACRDDVCDLPPAGIHVGHVIFFDYLGVPHCNPGRWAKWRYQFMRDPVGVTDHPMREYQRLIDAAFPTPEMLARSKAAPVL